MHCGRSRAALSGGALEESECASYVEDLRGEHRSRVFSRLVFLLEPDSERQVHL